MKDARIPLVSGALPDIIWQPQDCKGAVQKDLPGHTGHPVMIDSSLYDDFCSDQLYRYCSISEALNLISNDSWSFQHPSSWPDPYEKHLTTQLFGEGEQLSGMGVFAKCVSLDFRSNALWSMYANRAGVVRIGIRMADIVVMLANSVVTNPAKKGINLNAEFYISRCRYMEPQDLDREVKRVKGLVGRDKVKNAIRALAMKRDGFQYENEVRIAMVVHRSEKDRSDVRNLKFIHVPITSILIDPYLKPHDAEPLIELFRRCAPDSKVQQSGFNVTPV